MVKVAVSIVSFNTKDLLRKCIESLLGDHRKNKIEIWVVDNNSKDGSADMIEKEFQGVHLIKNSKNEGFAKGHNIALRRIKADFVLILNPDTEVSKDVIDGMLEFMKRNSGCGIASCKVLDFDEKLQPNAGDLPLGLALFAWLFNLEIFGILPNFHRNEESYYKTSHEVGWVSGSFMIIRKEVFDKVGFLNEDYFMYFEDTEFCYNAKKRGFSTMVNPEFAIKHLGGASSKDPRFRQWGGEMKGLYRFYNKEFGHIAGIFIKLLIYVATVLRILLFGVSGKIKIARTYSKVLLSI